MDNKEPVDVFRSYLEGIHENREETVYLRQVAQLAQDSDFTALVIRWWRLFQDREHN